MTFTSKTLGAVQNPEGVEKTVSIPGATLILGGALIGTYIGVQIGGPVGAAVGALVGTFVGAMAAGYIKNFKVILHKNGTVEIVYETRFS